MIPRFSPAIGWAEIAALFKPNPGAVQDFERAFARTFGAREALAFAYGRSALWAFFQAVGVRDAEVVMPAYTCSVVAHAVTLSGNRPRFVDIRLSDYNMDLDLLPAAINASTRAIVATHLFGYPLDLDKFNTIVAEAEQRYGHKIWIVQDCAHSFGATWKGRMVGSMGDVALYGLNISKTMTSIFGGMLTFQDQDLAKKVHDWREAHLTQPGMLKSWLRRLYLLAVVVAFNRKVYGLTKWIQEHTPFLNRLTKSYHLDDRIAFPPDHLDRMLDVEAAVGLAQLAKYPAIIKSRHHHAGYYASHLPKKPGWTLPPNVEGATYSHYVVLVPDRAACLAHMAQAGIQLGELIQYSVPELSSYPHIAGEACPNAVLASRHTVNLPVNHDLNSADLHKIVSAMAR